MKNAQRNRIIRLIKKTLILNKVKRAYLFGSFARHEKKYRDIDIAIDPPKGITLLGLAHIENLLESKTGKKIDLGTIESISPHVKKYFESERVALI